MRKLLLALSALLIFLSAFSQSPGSLDPTFGNGGRSEASQSAYVSLGTVVPLANGKLMVLGTISAPEYYLRPYLVRYNYNGTFDRTFSQDGRLIVDDMSAAVMPVSMAVQKDGKVLVAGYIQESTSVDFGVFRYTVSGQLDTTFGINGKVSTDIGYTENNQHRNTNDYPSCIAVQADGKIVVVGRVYSNSSNGITGGLVRYNTNGSVDLVQRFYSEFAGSDDNFPKVSTYNDGGYVITAEKNSASLYLYSSRFGERMINLPAYGTGESESDGTELYDQQHHILSNGKIAVISFGDANEQSRSDLHVFNADGSLDSDFSEDGYMEFDFHAYSVTSENNGRIMVSGDMGTTRYNADGTIDGSFGEGDKISASAYSIATYGNRFYVPDRSSVRAYLLNTDPRSVKVNLYGNSDPYNHGEWNNWNNLRNLHFDNFYYSDSTYSPIDAVMSNRKGVNDNGANYGGSNTLMAPKGVLRHSSYSIAARTVTLSGLAASKKYDLELYSSRNDHSGNSTIFTINGVVKSISTYRNYTGKVVFSNLTPEAGGQLVISIKSSKEYNYLNGFILTEKFNSTATTETLADNAAERSSIEESKTAPGALVAHIFPNPAQSYFTLKLQSQSSDPVQLRMTDGTGRVVEQKTVAANTTLTFGRAYKHGAYFVEVVQGTERKVVKLLKTN